MRVMLLAAGKSTRLGPLGEERPKPLVPVCGYPAIRFGIELARRAGLRDLVVNLHHCGDDVREALGDGVALGVRIAYSPEADLLGTGGGLVHARPLFGAGAVLVMNAKVVADVDLPVLLAAHAAAAAAGAEATMLVRDDPDPRRWGAIASDAAGRVVGILGARSPAAPTGTVVERMFTGIHVVEPALLARLPRSGASDIVRDAYLPALGAGARIAAVTLPGYFAEHSTPERYLAGNLALLDEPDLLRHPPGDLTGVDPGARADGATLLGPCRLAPGAFLGAGSVVQRSVVSGRVAPGARVVRSVVWPQAVADGDVADSIVTPGGVLATAPAKASY